MKRVFPGKEVKNWLIVDNATCKQKNILIFRRKDLFLLSDYMGFPAKTIKGLKNGSFVGIWGGYSIYLASPIIVYEEFDIYPPV